VVFSRGQSAIGWVFVIFLLLSLARYVERRFKGNQHAFWYMITLDSIAKRK
jgi:hypothetical protein